MLWALIQAAAGKTVAGWTSTICIICLLGGIQLISLGVLGQYIGKTYLETKRRPRYIISARTWEKEERIWIEGPAPEPVSPAEPAETRSSARRRSGIRRSGETRHEPEAPEEPQEDGQA